MPAKAKAKAKKKTAVKASKLDNGATRARELSAIAHDLRNPLSVMLVSVRLLQRALGPEHATKRHVDALERATEEMNAILQDLSDATRIETGELLVDCEPTEIGEALRRPLAASRFVADAKGVRLEARVEDGLPKVGCDRERLERVLGSLVANAVRYAPRDSAVEISARRGERGAIVEVHDRGPGLAASDRELAFARTAPKPSVQGTGLAMFVARGVVEAIGGSAGARARDGGGATYFVELPFARD